MKIRSGHRWKSFMTAFCTMMCVPMVEKKFSYLSLLTRAFTTSRSSKRNFFHHNASRISNLPRLLNSKQCKIILITFYYSSFTPRVIHLLAALHPRRMLVGDSQRACPYTYIQARHIVRRTAFTCVYLPEAPLSNTLQIQFRSTM